MRGEIRFDGSETYVGRQLQRCIQYANSRKHGRQAVLIASSGCVGGCAKPSPAITVERSSRRNSRRGASGKKVWWSSSPEDMDNNVNDHHSVKNPSVGSTSQTEEAQTLNRTDDNASFVNHALNMWNENRRQWVGNRPQNRPQMSKEPVISWTTTYDDLLATNQPFAQPIPLPEMIDFLVDVWQEEGLYE